MIRVIVNGALGKMGKTIVESIADEPDLELSAQAGRSDDLGQLIKKHKADVVIDFTAPVNIFEQVQMMIDHDARPVIGTTGLSLQQISTLQKQCKKKSLGGIIAPNFSLTAILMMRYARDAARYFPDAEIIEMHHPKKVDAPSGTAKKTAQMIHEAKFSSEDHPASYQQMSPVKNYRDEKYQEIPIHSIRLSGYLSSQMVLFGGQDERLTIQQDNLSRKSFMPGLFLSCRKIMELNYMVYGLDNLL